jgi:type IV pilus assembly protein PilC
MTKGMQVFNYKAINSDGLVIHGEVMAMDAGGAEAMLREKGYLIKTINNKRQIWELKKRVNRDDFIQFITEFIALIRAGLTVPEALGQCSNRPANPRLSNVLQASLKAINEGAPLSDAVALFPDVFDTVIISSIRTGESAGDLASPLEKYRSYMERRNNLRKKVAQALVYPLFILVAMAIILTVLFVFVMPRFVTLYSDFNAELPAPTRLIIFIVSNMGIILPAAAVAVILAYAGLKAAGRSYQFRLLFDDIKLGLPLFGGIAGPLEIAGLARTLFTLLSGGMTLAEALKTAKDSVKNTRFLKRLDCTIARIYSGEGFAAAAAEENLMPATAIKLLEAGESSGMMDAMLGEIASYYEQIAESRITSMMTIIEPALIFLTGILVGGVIIAMYLPIFKLAEIVR